MNEEIKQIVEQAIAPLKTEIAELKVQIAPLLAAIPKLPVPVKEAQQILNTIPEETLAALKVVNMQFDGNQCWVSLMRQDGTSSTGTCFDIGTTVARALREFERTGNPFSGSTDPNTAGNGSLMKLAPIPMFYFKSPPEAIDRAGESSRTTHGAETAVDACRYFGGLLVGALNGLDKEALLSPRFCPVAGYWEEHPLHPAIAAVAQGSFKTKAPPAIRGTGYVVESLEPALWAFHRADSFREAVLSAVNLGDDADTTGAICGQLAGAFCGLSSIPKTWRRGVCKADLILGLADQLSKISSY